MRRSIAKLAGIRLSIWLSLAALTVSASFVTWRYMVSTELDGQKASIFAVFGWMFWMVAVAVAFIWLCWVKTESGWRWRWRRF